MKHHLRIALLFVFVLGIVGFQSRAEATEYDNSGGLPQASNSRSKPMKTETNDWERTLVDLDGSWGVSLALDSANIPHISYYAHEEWGQTPATWKYATKQGHVWNTEQVVDPSTFYAANVYSSSIVLDSNDSPHITFGLLRASPPYSLIITHAFKQAGTWQFEEIEVIENKCSGHYVTLLSDSSGGLHLFYTVSINDGSGCRSVLKYARQVGTNSWQVSTLVEDNVGSFSVVIDSENDFHLAYTSYVESGSLHYSKFGSIDQFSPATIFTYSPIGSPSVALDKSNTPHIAFIYYKPYDYELYVAHQGATEWIIENSEKQTGGGGDIDAFFDAQDNLHVYAGNVYGFNAVVEHYYKTQDGWQAKEIGAPAANISFVLDSSESVHGAAVHFSYGTESSWSLWYHHKLGDALTYNISGRVTTQSGTPIPGVVIGTAAGSISTDSDGSYTITDLPTGTYNIDATLPGYSFAPSTRSVSVPPNAASQDFVGTPDAMTDTDGDGLLDDWEINGYHHDNGDIVDLPAMGADPYKPDIFVEVDWMEGHKPKDDAIRRIVDSFANAPVYDEADNQIGTGINLHVDVGPDSIDYGRDKPKAWGENGRGNKLDKYINHIPDSELRAITEQIQDGNFDQARRSIFHYSIWANKYDDQRLLTRGASGVSLAVWEMPVFYVTLGTYSDGVGSVNEQAGTFMHELGHNLGLNHGGDQVDDPKKDYFNFKPNYLSIMNYSFQMGGLIIDGDDGCESCFDYSRFDLPDLNEAQLIESEGLSFPDTVTRSYGTKYFAGFFPESRACYPAAWDLQFVLFTKVENATGGINWNCSFLPPHIETSPVQEDINGRGGDSQLLTGYNDWANLNFSYAHTAVRGRSALFSTFQVGDLSLLPQEITSDIDKTIPRLSESRVQLYAFVDSPMAAPHEILTYTVGAYTVDANSIDDFLPQFLMPPGFTYVPGSTTGVLTLEPETNGQGLTWPPIAIPSDGSGVDFSFQVQAGTEQGLFFAAVHGTSNTGLVFPEDQVAPVQVGGMLFLPFVVEN